MIRARMSIGIAVAFAMLVSRASSATTIVVTVTANPQWTETPILLSPGDTLSVFAEGSWAHGVTVVPYGPDGAAAAGGGRPTDDAGFISAEETKGALIGAIATNGADDDFFKSLGQDHSSFFLVGSSHLKYTAPTGGVLYLGFNDWGLPGNEGATTDNAGSVQATVITPAIPEPATLTLVLAGLLILAARRLR